METPKGIQRTRKRGWRLPPNAICVTRPGKWGNPFDWRLYGKSKAVEMFQAAMLNQYAFEMDEETRKHIENIRDTIFDLRGYDLACWCGLDEPCHRNVLLKLANE